MIISKLIAAGHNKASGSWFLLDLGEAMQLTIQLQYCTVIAHGSISQCAIHGCHGSCQYFPNTCQACQKVHGATVSQGLFLGAIIPMKGFSKAAIAAVTIGGSGQ